MIHKVLLTGEILIKRKYTNVANNKQKHLKKLKIKTPEKMKINQKLNLVFHLHTLISSLTQLRSHFPLFSPYITQVLKHTQVSVTLEVQSSTQL